MPANLHPGLGGRIDPYRGQPATFTLIGLPVAKDNCFVIGTAGSPRHANSENDDIGVQLGCFLDRFESVTRLGYNAPRWTCDRQYDATPGVFPDCWFIALGCLWR